MSSIICLVAAGVMFISALTNKKEGNLDKFVRINEVLYKKI